MGQRRILVVEDSLTQAEQLRFILERDGYLVVTVSNGEDALQVLPRKRFDLVISDVVMPGMNGYEVCRRIKQGESSQQIPVILLSHLDKLEDVLKGLACGADDFLIKPYEHPFFLARIKYIVDSYSHHVDTSVDDYLETSLAGKKFFIPVRPRQMLDFLLGIYESTITKNNQLQETNEQLRIAQLALKQLNEKLQRQVRHQTQRLTISEHNYQKLLESHADAVVVVDLEGNVCFANPAAQTMFNRKLLVGTSFQFSLSAGQTKEVTIQKGNGTIIAEMRVDETSWAEEPALLAVLRDITQRKRSQEMLEIANRSLEEAMEKLQTTQKKVVQQERLRALGEMASGIAHDFNNALSPILGFCELLLMRPNAFDDKEKVRNRVELIRLSAQDASKVVGRLREFYRERNADEEFEDVNLMQTVEMSISLTQPKWKDQAQAKGIDIFLDAKLQSVPPIWGNAAELREILTNLIFNAVDAMPQGGTLTIQVYQEEKEVLLVVGDTGIGMDEQTRQHCIEPFFTTKGGEGTGLGLAMVYGSIQRHQGTIQIESNLGEGTTFIIRFPLRELGFATKNKDPKNLQTTRKLRILVIEDDPIIREIIDEYIANDGHTVETAGDGNEGLTKYNQSQFDLVITDRAMPGMSGDQVAYLIKVENPQIPVIMLTGFSDTESREELLKYVDAVVGKPVTITSLRTAIDTVTTRTI